jgi:hypothetical protein
MSETAETNPAEKGPLNKEEIVKAVKTLNLSAGSYIVFGSGPLAAAGIRKAGDIDMLVAPAVYERLQKEGWPQKDKGPNDKPLVRDGLPFEIHASWDFSPYAPTLQDLLTTATLIDDVPFAALEEVRKWKAVSGGTKNVADVALIDAYLEKK